MEIYFAEIILHCFSLVSQGCQVCLKHDQKPCSKAQCEAWHRVLWCGGKQNNHPPVKVIGNTPAAASVRFIELLVASLSEPSCLAFI
jgi:hypothetical protein